MIILYECKTEKMFTEVLGVSGSLMIIVSIVVILFSYNLLNNIQQIFGSFFQKYHTLEYKLT